MKIRLRNRTIGVRAKPTGLVSRRAPRRRVRFGRALHGVDLAVFRWVAGVRAPALDATLPKLSRMADHGGLWTAVAVALAAGGGRFGRRAAVRGLGALSLTSAIVNLPAKLAARRTRPALDIVPEVRRLARIPVSSSFPSGHSASAAAFATGAALEMPRLAAPLGLLAAGVAGSRVYTGVHYPGDVLAGVAVGAAVALASRGLWPVTPPPGGEGTPVAGYARVRPLPDGEGLVVVANSAAGSALFADPVEVVRRRLPAATVREVSDGDDLMTVLADAAADAEVLGVAGGDGSVNAAAAVARSSGRPLAVFPAGTLNHLARDLGLATADDAVDAVQAGERVTVDLAEAAGEPFCNAVCIGSYPELVDARERLRPRIGQLPAHVLALVKAFQAVEPTDLELDGRRHAVWLLFVGNCRYEEEGIAPAWRRRLDDGLLDVRVVRADRRWARTRLLAAVATGTVERCGVYERRLQPALAVRSLGGPLRVTRDGEAFDCPATFTIDKCAEPLTVYAPHR